MKVLDLRCGNEHAFEGWFGSEEDFQTQLAQSRLQCPVCGTPQVRKVLSAPRLNFGAQAPAARTATEAEAEAEAEKNGGSASTSTSTTTVAAPLHPGAAPASAARSPLEAPADLAHPDLQAAWWHWARQAVSRSDDVGPRFAEEARRMHQGDAPERAIHGQASVQETLELLEEGIAVLRLPDSVTDKLH